MVEQVSFDECGLSRMPSDDIEEFRDPLGRCFIGSEHHAKTAADQERPATLQEYHECATVRQGTPE
jgi:hypothetical protein